MCIPNTFLFEHGEARVNAGRWDRTSVVLLVQGVERESSVQGAKPRLRMWGLQIRKWKEKEKWYRVIGGDYLQVCARNSIIKTAQILCLLPRATPTRSVPEVTIIEYPTANGYGIGMSFNRRMVCVRTWHRQTDSFRSHWTFGTFRDTITLDVDTPQDHSDRTRKREFYGKPATKSYISEIRFLSSSLPHWIIHIFKTESNRSQVE